VLRVVIPEIKILQNQTVFVIYTLFLNEGVRTIVYFYDRVLASKKVGNLWPIEAHVKLQLWCEPINGPNGQL